MRPETIAFWFSYFVWIGAEIWIFSRDRRAASGDAADRGSRRLLLVLYAIGLTAAFAWARTGFGGMGGRPAATALGLVLMWAGMALRLWAVITLGRFFRTSVMVLDDHRLITTGPYRRLRNPSYTGALTTAAGVGAALGNWVSLALLLGSLIAGYAWRIRVEDAALRGRFGAEYEAYRRSRWALVPAVW
jgi:protein-S-isoprenylcysteine O-methyltransferase